MGFGRPGWWWWWGTITISGPLRDFRYTKHMPPPPLPLCSCLHIFPNPFCPLPSGASRMTDMENKPSEELHKGQSQAAEPQLKRSLGARHLQMLAIASSIGTGLFIGSGKALSTGGPFSLVFSFAWLGLVLATMMRKCPLLISPQLLFRA